LNLLTLNQLLLCPHRALCLWSITSISTGLHLVEK